MAGYTEAQFGFAEESTWGTRVTPTRFLPFTAESMEKKIEYKSSESYRTGRRVVGVRRPMATICEGDFEFELAPQGLGLLMKHMFGTVNTTGTNPYTHTFTPGTLLAKGLTVQKGVVGSDGTMRPFDYTGCKVTGWEVSCKVGDFATLKVSLMGQQEDTAQSLASASYPANWAPFSFVDGSVTVGGAATPLKELTISADNGMSGARNRIQATNPTTTLEPLEQSLREYTGTLVADFASLTAYNRFVNQTQAAIVATFSAGASAILVATMNVEFDGETPKATGPGNETEQPLPFKCLHASSDASAITFALTNADTTP